MPPEFAPDPASLAAMTSSRPTGHGAVRAYDWISHHAAQRGSKEAIRDLGAGRSFTYAELDQRADAMAACFRSLGIGRGDRVAVLAHNGVEYFDIQFACARTGSICVLLNWRLTVTELEYILNDSSPKLLVHDATFAGHRLHPVENIPVLVEGPFCPAFNLQVLQVFGDHFGNRDLRRGSLAFPLLQFDIGDLSFPSRFLHVRRFQGLALLPAIELVTRPPGLAAQVNRDVFADTFGFRLTNRSAPFWIGARRSESRSALSWPAALRRRLCGSNDHGGTGHAFQSCDSNP